MKAFMTFVCLLMSLVFINGQDINECLKQDSISCIQKNIYRRARQILGNEDIEVLKGVSLVTNGNRNSKSDKDVMYDQEIDQASSVLDRQSVLEKYFHEEANELITGRNIKINLHSIAEAVSKFFRDFIDFIPKDVNEAANVLEGRAKKKLNKLLPLLLAAKAKVGILATLAFFGIALLAKKAILVSIISLAISGFIGLRNMWSKGGVTPYNAGWTAPAPGGYVPPSNNGWSAGGTPGGWDEAAYPTQNQGFTGYH